MSSGCVDGRTEKISARLWPVLKPKRSKPGHQDVSGATLFLPAMCLSLKRRHAAPAAVCVCICVSKRGGSNCRQAHAALSFSPFRHESMNMNCLIPGSNLMRVHKNVRVPVMAPVCRHCNNTHHPRHCCITRRMPMCIPEDGSDAHCLPC
jgi:hypothetical protein